MVVRIFRILIPLGSYVRLTGTGYQHRPRVSPGGVRPGADCALLMAQVPRIRGPLAINTARQRSSWLLFGFNDLDGGDHQSGENDGRRDRTSVRVIRDQLRQDGRLPSGRNCCREHRRKSAGKAVRTELPDKLLDDGGHAEDVHVPGRHLHDEPDVQALEEDRVNGEEVAGQQSLRLSAQKRPQEVPAFRGAGLGCRAHSTAGSCWVSSARTARSALSGLGRVT